MSAWILGTLHTFALFYRLHKCVVSELVGYRGHQNISSKQMGDRNVVSMLNQMRLRLMAGDSNAGGLLLRLWRLWGHSYLVNFWNLRDVVDYVDVLSVD